jgi:hypothetical protein
MTCECDLKRSLRNTAMYGQAPRAVTLFTIIWSFCSRSYSVGSKVDISKTADPETKKHLPQTQKLFTFTNRIEKLLYLRHNLHEYGQIHRVFVYHSYTLFGNKATCFGLLQSHLQVYQHLFFFLKKKKVIVHTNYTRTLLWFARDFKHY